MKLSKYLADYINHELEENDYHADEGRFTDVDLIQQGIEAFESSEDCKLAVVNLNQVIKQRVIIKVDSETFPIVEKSNMRIIFLDSNNEIRG